MSGPNTLTSLGAVSAIVKAASCQVYALTAFNANASSRYIQLFDQVAALAGSEVPVFTCLVPAGGQIVIGTDFFSNEGFRFVIGLVFGFSTARESYTAGTAANHSLILRYA